MRISKIDFADKNVSTYMMALKKVKINNKKILLSVIILCITLTNAFLTIGLIH